MIRSLLVLAILLLASIPCFSQSVDTAWVRSYDGPENSHDDARALAVDSSGNVYVTGYVTGSGSGYDYLTIKYLPNGDTAWVKSYNGPGNYDDKAAAIAVDGSGNVYVTGCILGSGTGYDYATIKYESDGDTVWLRSYDGPGNLSDFASAIAVDGSGNVYVTGESKGSGTDNDYATIKYYSNGDTAWVRRYSGPAGSDKAYALVLDGSGNVYVTGESYNSSFNQDYVTIKYGSSGNELWAKRYNGAADSNDVAQAIAVDHSGNVYVTGYSRGSGIGDDYLTIKYYPNGDTAWVRRYNGPDNGTDEAVAVAVDQANNIYVVGYSDSTGTYSDYLTIKYDSSGNEIWLRRYNGSANGSDEATAITVDGSDDVYVTGWSGGGLSGYDYATIKYYSNGDTAWVKRYDGLENDNDNAQAIAVDDSGNVYVTGKSRSSETNYDFCTIKYVQISTDVKDETESREKPSEFALYQNYPNPFNPATKIEFTLAKPGFVTLQIYNVLGRKITTLISEHLSSGYKSVIWDGKDNEGQEVASGVYWYKLSFGDFSESKRLVLLK